MWRGVLKEYTKAVSAALLGGFAAIPAAFALEDSKVVLFGASTAAMALVVALASGYREHP